MTNVESFSAAAGSLTALFYWEHLLFILLHKTWSPMINIPPNVTAIVSEDNAM
jgi:hypothetical protein